MKKKPLIIVITDTHLNNKNIELVIDIFKQAIIKAKELGLTVIYHGGDIFDSRKYQTLATLKAFVRILNMLEAEGITLRCIPGNHDKPDYASQDSYLDIYSSRYSIEVVKSNSVFVEQDGWSVHMIPFFDEKEVYPGYLKRHLKEAEFSKKNILITHIAVNGVRNNDGSQIEDTLEVGGFDDFDKVLVGHYHNKQEVKNITYIGSAYQKDYGEDEDKGLTLVYDDGSLERIPLVFPRFKTVKIDLNTITPQELEKAFKSHEKSPDSIRFKFSGTKEKLTKLDTAKYDKAGIDVKKEQDDPEIDMDYATLINFAGFDQDKILKEWDEFSEKHKIEEEIAEDGKKRLQQTFKE